MKGPEGGGAAAWSQQTERQGGTLRSVVSWSRPDPQTRTRGRSPLHGTEVYTSTGPVQGAVQRQRHRRGQDSPDLQGIVPRRGWLITCRDNPPARCSPSSIARHFLGTSARHHIIVPGIPRQPQACGSAGASYRAPVPAAPVARYSDRPLQTGRPPSPSRAAYLLSRLTQLSP